MRRRPSATNSASALCGWMHAAWGLPAQRPPSSCWVAAPSTDADSEVPGDWLVGQLEQPCDAFCGLVDIAARCPSEHRLRRVFQGRQQWGEGHRRIHGANLGVSAHFYRAVGGFPALRCGEDVQMVRALQACGADVRWAGAPVVFTSARLEGRAAGGFSAYLAEMGAAGAPAVLTGPAIA